MSIQFKRLRKTQFRLLTKFSYRVDLSAILFKTLAVGVYIIQFLAKKKKSVRSWYPQSYSLLWVFWNAFHTLLDLDWYRSKSFYNLEMVNIAVNDFLMVIRLYIPNNSRTHLANTNRYLCWENPMWSSTITSTFSKMQMQILLFLKNFISFLPCLIGNAGAIEFVVHVLVVSGCRIS